jgi:hypothetical protein
MLQESLCRDLASIAEAHNITILDITSAKPATSQRALSVLREWRSRWLWLDVPTLSKLSGVSAWQLYKCSYYESVLLGD